MFGWLRSEKVLYYPGCVRNPVSQGCFADGVLRWWDASLVGCFAGRDLSNLGAMV